MAGVAFGGNTGDCDLNLGGVVGYICSFSHGARIKNCANYGSVTHSGTSSSSNIGGIVGYLPCDYSGSSLYKYIYNCINYGAITHSSTTSRDLYLGGIVGSSKDAYIENCVSAGRISSTSTSYIGSIVGQISSGTNIAYCYYTSDVGVSSIYGRETPKSETETPNSPSAVNSTLIAKLNDYASKNDNWNKWLFNENNASVSFIINYRKGFNISSQIILLPDPANNSEHSFSGWYIDATMTTPFNLSQVKSNITLYGMFCGSFSYTVTLDVNEGNELGESEINAGCMNYYGPFPTPTREGYTFTGWFTEREGGDKIKPGDKVKTLNSHTLYAQWAINNYIVIFDVNGGNVSITSMTVTFNSTYGPLPTPTKEGYMFLGWFTDNNVNATNETVVRIADNHTLHAHWAINNYTVAFDFNNGTIVNDTFVYNASIEYPKKEGTKKEGYIFSGWNESDIIHMPAQNITITAQWNANNYTVTFDANGGNVLDNYTMTVTFNSPYGPLPIPIKEGHMFLGWFTDNNESVTNETIVDIADNHTLHAHWENTTNQVKIVFSSKDLTEKEVEELLKQYAKAKFTIVKYENGDDSEGIMVIIKFTDNESAKNFVENIRGSSELNNIKKIGFISESDVSSISSILYPILFYVIILFI